MYHDKFGVEFSLGVHVTVEVIILLDPFHRADGNGDAFIALGVVVVGDHHLVHLVDDLPRLFLVDLHVWLVVDALHRDHQQLVVLVLYYFSDLLQHAAHAEGVFVVGSDEGRHE